MRPSNPSPVVDAIFRRVLARYSCQQAFLFGSEGDPFWAVRTPIAPHELGLLKVALDLIETLESSRPKPFVGHDASRQIIVAALDEAEDLYVVVLQERLDPKPLAAYAAALRADFRPYLPDVRREVVRRCGTAS